MAIITIFLFVIVGMGAAYLLNGFALTLLWEWFIVPFGLTPISLPWAIGVSIIVGFLTGSNNSTKGEEVDWVKATVSVFIRPLLAILIGWIVKLFM